LFLPDQPFTFGLAADLVGVRAVERGRVALDAVPEGVAEVDALLVGEPELLRELVHP